MEAQLSPLRSPAQPDDLLDHHRALHDGVRNPAQGQQRQPGWAHVPGMVSSAGEQAEQQQQVKAQPTGAPRTCLAGESCANMQGSSGPAGGMAPSLLLGGSSQQPQGQRSPSPSKQPEQLWAGQRGSVQEGHQVKEGVDLLPPPSEGRQQPRHSPSADDSSQKQKAQQCGCWALLSLRGRGGSSM